jgi:hypothetical protein
MQHGSRNQSGKQVPSSMRLLLVTTLVVFICTSWLITMNFDQNLLYLHQRNAPHLQEEGIETNDESNYEDPHFQNDPCWNKCDRTEAERTASIVASYKSIHKKGPLLQLNEEDAYLGTIDRTQSESTNCFLQNRFRMDASPSLRLERIIAEKESDDCRTFRCVAKRTSVTAVLAKEAVLVLKIVGHSTTTPPISVVSCISSKLILPTCVDFIASSLNLPVSYLILQFCYQHMILSRSSSVDFHSESEKVTRLFVSR